VELVSRSRVLAVLLLASGCFDPTPPSERWGSGYGGSGFYATGYGSGQCGGVATGSYDYTYTCPLSGEYTVPVPADGCRSESEYFARIFGCNEIYEMYDACVAYGTCYCQDLATCEAYR
jgi:hypothetical protein